MLQRNEFVEEHGQFPPLMCFAEGTCTNNTCMMKFRRGAFYDLKPVIPITIKWQYGDVHPAVESIDEGPLVFLLCCSL